MLWMNSRFSRPGAHRRSGTSLVEVLVVIVVFLIGIMAMMQIFPGGLRILKQSRDRNVAITLARAEMERITATPSALPEQIVPVRHRWSGSSVIIEAAPERFGNDLSPMPVAALGQDGHFYDGSGNPLGSWPYLTGANTVRRVVGEAHKIPAPRTLGAHHGGLLVLQFGPTSTRIDSSTEKPINLSVVGQDLIRREGDVGTVGLQPYEYFLNNVNPALPFFYFPAAVAPGETRSYRLSFSAYVQTPEGIRKRDYLEIPPISASPNPNGFVVQAIPSGVFGSDTLVQIEPDSVRVAREFVSIPVGTAFSADPYEFKVLDPIMGTLLFNPVAYNYTVPRPDGRRLPLVARVNYDVHDWRIIREDFRVPDGDPPQFKLALSNLKALGNPGVDGVSYPGLGDPSISFRPRDASGNSVAWDVILLDLETGGYFSYDSSESLDSPGWNPSSIPDTSFYLDRSLGLLRMVDVNPLRDGFQGRLIIPETSGVRVEEVNVVGRSLRVLYEAHGEWSVQVLKAPSVYTATFTAPTLAQFYIGASSALGGNGRRIYFPNADVGQKVTVGEIWYRATGDSPGAPPRSLREQSFVIQSPFLVDLPYPYIDLAPLGVDTFDFEQYGYAVRDVKGASVSVRVLWNTEPLTLGSNGATNLETMHRWGREWKQVSTETYLRRGEH